MTRRSSRRPYRRDPDFWSLEDSEAGNPSEAVPRLVHARAQETPDALALAMGSRRLTYRQLDVRAERLAHQLSSSGVGPDVVVGLCFNSSPAMIVGALGILKAGGAYLPLDPAYPRARLANLLRQADPPVLVTAECLREQVPEGPWRVIRVDADGLVRGSETFGSAPAPVSAGHIAYVIYTSGSTGEPKAVEITHGSLLNLVKWHRRTFEVSPSDRATQIAPVGFDAAVWEVWPYLCAGASVHVPEEAVRRDPEALRDWLISEGISLTFAPTVMAERLMALRWPAETPLRTLLTGGDTLRFHPSPDLPFSVVNNYGPTECTVVAISGLLRPDEGRDTLPPLGRPIDNTEVYVLGESLEVVRPGDPGELCLGGAGLARGYRNRPDLTAERFVDNPFNTRPGARLYRTGDLVRTLPDGRIVFLGRVDEQIKIRGYRIEPAEISAALSEHDAVRESVVAARDGARGDKALVAYITTAPGRRPTQTEMRAFLAERLPEHMVPATFVVLEALPLSMNGKVDRASLPPPEGATILRDDTFVAPSTKVEERVGEVLARLLGLDRVGAQDNFFLLGGHSMLGTQLIARLRDVFSVELSLRTLFESPTVAALSAAIEQLLRGKLEAMSEEEAERMLQPPPRAQPALPLP